MEVLKYGANEKLQRMLHSLIILIRVHNPFSEQREHLLDDYDGMDPPVLGPQPDYYAPMNYMPPPPAYTP